jgi:hypothetical protein
MAHYDYNPYKQGQSSGLTINPFSTGGAALKSGDTYLENGQLFMSTGWGSVPVTNPDQIRKLLPQGMLNTPQGQQLIQSAERSFAASPYGQAQAAGNTKQQLLDEYKRAYGEAKSANETRYADILAGYQDRYNRNMADIKTVGAQAESDTRKNYFDAMARNQQNLAARGMSGGTMGAVLDAGNTREMNADLNRLRDQLTQQRVGLDTQLSGDLLGFKERRTDSYPDLGQLAALMQGYGQGTGGGGIVTSRKVYSPGGSYGHRRLRVEGSGAAQFSPLGVYPSTSQDMMAIMRQSENRRQAAAAAAAPAAGISDAERANRIERYKTAAKSVWG